jgi:hypothetical protein
VRLYYKNNKAKDKAMNELLEMVEDLEMIETVGTDSPGFEHIINKWRERLADAEADLERQYELFQYEVGVS